MSEVNMPRLSDTMQEGTISRWLKKQGDQVKKGDILAEIETDKANMELESYEGGVLEQVLVQEGQSAPIGQAIAVIGSGTATKRQEQPLPTSPADRATGSKPTQAVSSQQEDKPSKQSAAQSTSESAQRQEDTSESSDNGVMLKASPLARRMAEEYGIDLRHVQGTGPGGRIVRDDIEDVHEQRSVSVPPTLPSAQPQTSQQEAPAPVTTEISPSADVEVSKLSRMQAAIARRLSEAKQTIPHFYVRNEVNMTNTLALRQMLNSSVGEDGVKVSVNDLIVKACALALEKFPEVNSSFKDGQFLRHKHINIGIAVDIPAGLVVPVISDANRKGVRTIARESRTLIEKARTNKLSQADLDGSTFSISNLGMMDVSEFIAVINPPEAAILAVASIRKQFVPIDGQPVIQDLMPLTISADHRILYGAAAARFLQEIKRLLENPYTLLG